VVELELEPILGQFLVEEPVPADPLGLGAVVLGVVVLGAAVGLVVAALATKAPPATRPLLKAPMAMTGRNRIFTMNLLSCLTRRSSPSVREVPDCALDM
jgi:hypothetical protein